jgi:hypothetical protein
MGDPVAWGSDAWEWLANAEAQGNETASSLLPGEIVVYRRGDPYDPRYGHGGSWLSTRRGPDTAKGSRCNVFLREERLQPAPVIERSLERPAGVVSTVQAR